MDSTFVMKNSEKILVYTQHIHTKNFNMIILFSLNDGICEKLGLIIRWRNRLKLIKILKMTFKNFQCVCPWFFIIYYFISKYMTSSSFQTDATLVLYLKTINNDYNFCPRLWFSRSQKRKRLKAAKWPYWRERLGEIDSTEWWIISDTGRECTSYVCTNLSEKEDQKEPGWTFSTPSTPINRWHCQSQAV